MNKAVSKYLQYYQEPEAALFQSQLIHTLKPEKKSFQHLICLPCYAEPIEHLHRLVGFLGNQKHTLLIVVLNQPDNLNPEQQKEKLNVNQQWLDYFQNSDNDFKQSHKYGLFKVYQQDSNTVLIVDRFFENSLPAKQGVGLARKIGADIALTLYAENLVSTRWLHNIDADVQLELSYLCATEKLNFDTAAAVYPFRHINKLGDQVSIDSESKIEASTAIYEKRLYQYQQGLLYADSQYAFHTIGSCIALSLEHYAQARGFPKQSAGEDFYLLNKLRKLGDIECLNEPHVEIFSRVSNRTPFGTGAAVSDILALDDPLEAKIFYPPLIFEGLKVFILWQKKLANDFNHHLPENWQDDLANFSDRDWSRHLVNASIAIDFDKGLSHCVKQSKTKEAFEYQMFCWFDAFKTLKWTHALRDGMELGMKALIELE